MRRALRYRNSDTNRPIFRTRRHIALLRQRRYAACVAVRAVLRGTGLANRLHRVLIDDEAAIIGRSTRHGAGKTSKRVGTARNPGQRAKFARMSLRDVVDQRKVDADIVDMA